MTESDERQVKEAIMSSIAYSNSDEPVRFGDRARATLLLDNGSEVVGDITEVQFWFNDMDQGSMTVVSIDDGDEFCYCDPDGIELVGDGADG